jgi:MFS family permease
VVRPRQSFGIGHWHAPFKNPWKILPLSIFAAFVLINTFLEYFLKDQIQHTAGSFLFLGKSLHIDDAESAMAVYSIVQQSTCIVFVVKGGAVSDQLGRRPVLAVSLLVLALCIGPFGSVTLYSTLQEVPSGGSPE